MHTNAYSVVTEYFQTSQQEVFYSFPEQYDTDNCLLFAVISILQH